MKLWIGTSGFSYPEWKGSFYPENMPTTKMFGFYSQHFSTVEINATFYRMPTDKLVLGWAETAPAGFRYTLKAPKTITYIKQLKECEQPVSFFLGRAEKLGVHRGALLFHLPPYLKKDVALLRDFLTLVPREMRATFEFRSSSWHDEEVYTALADAGAALCISDSEKLTTPLVATTSWGYFRLRDEGYTNEDLVRWHSRITEQKWDEAFVYFKHEDAGKGAQLGAALKAICAASTSAG
ncbi:MAG: DUF72 domain-containing protein [Polyangiaceae bacterium]|nr:DUF72 domain-containing protein [Polyangiaceae bacterium]